MSLASDTARRTTQEAIIIAFSSVIYLCCVVITSLSGDSDLAVCHFILTQHVNPW